jgi:ADP-heptose:LPS heptosyltransferase
MFVVGEADSEIAARLKEEKSNVPVLSECSLMELAEVLSACRGYVGNDSGITHLAASLGIAVVALYGPTDPAIWGARGANVKIVEGKERTTQDLAGITVEDVIAALQ